MNNMLPETIEITQFIGSGQYRLDSCEGRLDRLINLKPAIIDNTYENELLFNLIIWKTNYNNWLKKNKKDTINFVVKDLVKKTKYQYSYIPISDPIDVYRTDLNIEIREIKDFKLFIQLDRNGKIISNYQEHGWVINNCDSINSTIQNIYFN